MTKSIEQDLGLSRAAASRVQPHGSAIGVLLLETTYLDAPGSMSDRKAYAGAPLFETVRGALGSIVVGPNYRTATQAYVSAAQGVVARGADLVTANCGFAISYQDAVARTVGTATALSSLLLVPLLARVYPDSLGVLTYDAAQLDEERRRSAGWPPGPDIPVADVQSCPAWQSLRNDTRPTLDATAMQAELLVVAEEFTVRHQLKAVVLECTAMFPFAERLHRHTGTAVYDLIGLVNFLVAGMPSGAPPDRRI